jgi:hypothetical protein
VNHDEGRSHSIDASSLSPNSGVAKVLRVGCAESGCRVPSEMAVYGQRPPAVVVTESVEHFHATCRQDSRQLRGLPRGVKTAGDLL